MAQRQRAGLITQRSQDQNLVPLLFFFYKGQPKRVIPPNTAINPKLEAKVQDIRLPQGQLYTRYAKKEAMRKGGILVGFVMRAPIVY